MTRSIWRGDISFGLVSIPVSLTSTEENDDIHFHLLNAKTLARVITNVLCTVRFLNSSLRGA
ncbi:MAG: hypothetical protein Q8R83_05915 [Legionellaceae bacterium]|nr:hypothetical protein [Legionellaceae bacterium]